jgi:hypothetical protein
VYAEYVLSWVRSIHKVQSGFQVPLDQPTAERGSQRFRSELLTNPQSFHAFYGWRCSWLIAVCYPEPDTSKMLYQTGG